jgi:cyanate lyase
MITDDIRSAIIEQKKQRRLTYAKIAKKSGVSISTIHGYMYGCRGISTELAELILNAVGLEIKIVPMEGKKNG